jgi:hypothetical protein
MNLHKMIAELQDERERIDRAIEALERLKQRRAGRRGHAQAWLKKQLAEISNAERKAIPQRLEAESRTEN